MIRLAKGSAAPGVLADRKTTEHGQAFAERGRVAELGL
jgi:hypothetical protein